MAMLAFENDSHFELEAEMAILKRTCARLSCFSYVELLTDRLLLQLTYLNYKYIIVKANAALGYAGFS
jgi:hypothetical protein